MFINKAIQCACARACVREPEMSAISHSHKSYFIKLLKTDLTPLLPPLSLSECSLMHVNQTCQTHFSFTGFPQCADAPAGCVNPFPLFGTASPVCQRIAVVLPVEDGGGDAVWGWSWLLDLHKKRTRMDTKIKNEHIPISARRGLDSFGIV